MVKKSGRRAISVIQAVLHTRTNETPVDKKKRNSCTEIFAAPIPRPRDHPTPPEGRHPMLIWVCVEQEPGGTLTAKARSWLIGTLVLLPNLWRKSVWGMNTNVSGIGTHLQRLPPVTPVWWINKRSLLSGSLTPFSLILISNSSSMNINICH